MKGKRGLRTVLISALCIPLGAFMALVAAGLVHLIYFFTNVAFYGELSWAQSSPLHNRLGLGVVFIPVIGGILIGLMARFGSKAIRGHGIPEAMEKVLEGQSRIPFRLTWLKPLSAAISIGTGGPFGAEGPIIATGSASGSFLGQLLNTTAIERKTLLAAGAAAGMAATFGSPVSAVLLAVELLLFEFKPASFIPVALASAVGAAVHQSLGSSSPIFAMATIDPVGLRDLSFYIFEGLLLGVLSVFVTKVVYAVEDTFERLPIHWMWWPALGGIAVGLVGWVEPRTLGVGYNNISDILNVTLPVYIVAVLCMLKFVSWSVALGSGTSGGTLAPLLTFGSGAGMILGSIFSIWFPSFHIQPHLAALVGMAALFTGASQAMFASVVFACETTGQAEALLPLLGGCAASLLLSKILKKNSIMSEKIARRGVSVPVEYEADIYKHTKVGEVMETDVQMFPAKYPIEEILTRVASHDPEVCRHQALLLSGENGELVGILTRGDMIRAAESKSILGSILQYGNCELIVVFPNDSLHTAIEKLLHNNIGRLPVVSPENPTRLIGYLSRSAIIAARSKMMTDESHREVSWILGRKNTSNEKDS